MSLTDLKAIEESALDSARQNIGKLSRFLSVMSEYKNLSIENMLLISDRFPNIANIELVTAEELHKAGIIPGTDETSRIELYDEKDPDKTMYLYNLNEFKEQNESLEEMSNDEADPDSWVLSMSAIFTRFITGTDASLGGMPPILTGIRWQKNDQICPSVIIKDKGITELVINAEQNNISYTFWSGISAVIVELFNRNSGFNNLPEIQKKELAGLCAAVYLKEQNLRAPTLNLPVEYLKTHQDLSDFKYYLNLILMTFRLISPDIPEPEGSSVPEEPVRIENSDTANSESFEEEFMNPEEAEPVEEVVEFSDDDFSDFTS